MIYILLVIYMLCMTQASVDWQGNKLTITEEVGRAEHSFQSCGWTADSYRSGTQCADEDLAGFGRFLTFSLDCKHAKISQLKQTQTDLLCVNCIELLLNIICSHIWQHVSPSVWRARVCQVTRL